MDCLQSSILALLWFLATQLVWPSSTPRFQDLKLPLELLAKVSSQVRLYVGLYCHSMFECLPLVPCASIPDVSLTFGGKAFTISADTFNLGLVSEASSDCVGGIAAADMGEYIGAQRTTRILLTTLDLDFWVVGDVFLQNVYTCTWLFALLSLMTNSYTLMVSVRHRKYPSRIRRPRVNGERLEDNASSCMNIYRITFRVRAWFK